MNILPHPYAEDKASIERLCREWEEHGQLIIAYDFDNTVFDYHRQGHDYRSLYILLGLARQRGAYFIVFTAADESRYPHILEFLEENDIPYDSINEDKPGMGFSGRKIYYNILLDDRAGLGQSMRVLFGAITERDKIRDSSSPTNPSGGTHS